MPTPLFNSSTGKQASILANEARRKKTTLTKWLAKTGLKETETAKIFDLLQTAVATPIGTFLAGWFLIDLLDRIGYFNKQPQNAKQGAAVNNILAGIRAAGQNQINLFTNVLNNGLLSFIGSGNFTNALTGQSQTTGSTSSVDADLLKAGIFSIAMVQAMGGGQGINSLIAPLLTAATK